MKFIFIIIFLSINIISKCDLFPDFIFQNILIPLIRNPKDLNLREFLSKLVIDLPNDLIKNETKGYIAIIK